MFLGHNTIAQIMKSPSDGEISNDNLQVASLTPASKVCKYSTVYAEQQHGGGLRDGVGPVAVGRG